MNTRSVAPLHIAFLVDPDLHAVSDPEIRTAREELAAEGIVVEAVDAVPVMAAPQTLYLADRAATLQALQAAGCPAAGYLHAGNPGETFPHCPYVVSEPQWVDADSYHKIYERLVGLPWTILTTDRLMIREMTVDDLDALYELYDEEAQRYMTPLNADRDAERAQLRDYIDKVYGLFGYGYWALVDRTSERLIGRMGFSTEEAASFGYLIHRDVRRQGYAMEAAEAILPYAREVLGLSRICAEVHADNLPSIRFLEKLGFQRDIMQDNIYTYRI